MKELTRPKKGRVVFGVCQGIAEYFEIDPIIVRIVFIIITIWGGVGIVLYIIGIFLIPDEKKDNIKKEAEDIKKDKAKIKEKAKNTISSVAEEIRFKDKDQYSGSVIFGLIVLVLGLMILFGNIFPWFSWNKFWPLILVVAGLLIISGGRKGDR